MITAVPTTVALPLRIDGALQVTVNQALIIPANQSTTIVANSSMGASVQTDVSGIWVYNDGPGKLYYNYINPCDGTVNFMGAINPGGQVQVQTRQSFNVFSTQQCTVGITMITRNPYYGQPSN